MKENKTLIINPKLKQRTKQYSIFNTHKQNINFEKIIRANKSNQLQKMKKISLKRNKSFQQIVETNLAIDRKRKHRIKLKKSNSLNYYKIGMKSHIDFENDTKNMIQYKKKNNRKIFVNFGKILPGFTTLGSPKKTSSLSEQDRRFLGGDSQEGIKIFLNKDVEKEIPEYTKNETEIEMLTETFNAKYWLFPDSSQFGEYLWIFGVWGYLVISI